MIEKPNNLKSLYANHSESRQDVDLLMCEKILLGLYPRLHFQSPTHLFNALWNNTPVNLRRLVHIYCGDGMLTNWLALHFPKTEIVGIDPSEHKIAKANRTVGQRGNIRFIHGEPRFMKEIPCERILYSNPLSRNPQALAFKKMFMKTQSWLIDEGDWLIEESLLAAIGSGAWFNGSFLNGQSFFIQLKEALIDLGCYQLQTLEEETFLGIVTSTLIQSHVQPTPLIEELVVKPVSLPRSIQPVQREVKIPTPKTALDDIFSFPLHQQTFSTWEIH